MALEGLLGFISGLIRDSHSLIPIKDAVITITGLGGTYSSTEEGLYIIGPLPSGTYTVNFTKTGYATKVVAGVSVDGIHETFVDASLVPEAATITGEVYIMVNDQKIMATERAVVLMRRQIPIKTVTSNSSGVFTFSNLATGIYRVAAQVKVSSSATYYDRSGTIILMGGQTVTGIKLNLKLLKSSTQKML